MFRKNALAMVVGEFLGTAALALIVLALTHSQLGSLGWFGPASAGLMVALMTLALAGISGAVFNPAMTIGLWTVRKLKTVQALAYIVAQLLGGAVAWELFVYLTKVSGVHNTGHYDARVLVSEVVGTFIFAFGWAAAIYQRFDLPTKALTIGGSLTTGALVASLGYAGVLNPAVALSLHEWGWGTYVLGPVLGAVIGFNLYNLLFVETEVAEAAEASAEKAEKVKPAVIVAAPVKPAAKPAARTAAAKKPATRKAPAKKPAARKSTTTRRRNPNAA